MALCPYTELCLVKVQEGAKQIRTLCSVLSIITIIIYVGEGISDYSSLYIYIYIYIRRGGKYDVKEFVPKIMQYVLISIPEMRICASLRRTLPAACTP